MNVKKAVLRIAVPAVGASILAAAVGVGSASASTTAPWVREGSQGLGAQCVQAGLNYADNAGLSVDGIDGSKTTAAVRVFQRKFGLSADGVVGPQTGNLLWDAIKNDEGVGVPYFFCYNNLPTSY